MSVYLNGRAVAQPVRNGTPYNALHNGRKVWTAPKDTITSVAVLNVDGKPAPTSLPIDGSVTVAAQATYGDGHKGELLTTKGVSFATTTPDLVTVEGNKVAWRHGGTAVVTATIDGVKSGPVSIACAYKPESVTVSSGGKPVTTLTLAKDATVTIDVNVLPAEASQDVTVVSDHPDIVSVESVEGGFGLTAVKWGSAAVTVTATGTDVSTIIEVGVAAPVAPTLPADAPAGVTLDATHVQYSTKAVKYDVPAGGTVSALVFPSHSGKTQAQRVGLWVYVDPSNLGQKPSSSSSSYTQVTIGRGNGGGNGAKVMGCDALTGLHAGWNLCLFDDMAYGVGMTVSFRSQNGGNIWVDSLIVNPPMPAKTTVVFTHDVNPTQTAQYLAPLYAKYGLPFTWDTNNEHTGVSDQSITAMTKAGLTDWGMYSGAASGETLPDYATGDWTTHVNAMTDASRITGLPRASYVASTNNQSGAAYITALSNAGWPLIRCTYGGGVNTTIDPTYREAITVAPDQYAKKVDEWAGKGYTLAVTAHNVLPDDQATGSTDTKLSEFEPLLEKTKQLVDAGTVEVITMRQLAQRVAPDTLSDWDKQTN